MGSKFANQIGLHLLRDWRFAVFWISTSLTYLSHVTLHLFIPDRAVELGFSQHDAAMAIVVVNDANIFSRLVFGLTSSDKFFNHIILLVIYVFLSGLSSILVLIWPSYWLYVFFEITNSYVTTFMLYGGLEILRVLLLLPILIHSCCTKLKKNKR